MSPGQRVTAVDAKGRKLQLRLVGLTKQKAFVCKEEEFQRASKEGREPIAVGFPVEDVSVAKSQKGQYPRTAT